MRAYKFLDGDGCAPFTRTRWPADRWVESATVTPCRQGVHACAAKDLAHWLAASLWEIELDGEIVVSRHKLAARRGRLVRRIDEYEDAVRQLAERGAWRCRDRAVDVLRAEGQRQVADQFAEATTLEQLEALGGAVDDTSFARTAGALAADAAHFALHGDPAQSPFVAACSAGHAEAGANGDRAAYDRGYARERAFQSAWLADRLPLT